MASNKEYGLKFDIKAPFQYYFTRIPEKDKRIYLKLLEGISDLSRSIIVKGENVERIQRIFELVKFDNPLIFYVDQLKYSYSSIFSQIIVIPQYRFGKKDITNILFELQRELDLCCGKWKGLSDIEKERNIHDYLVKKVEYGRDQKASSFEAVGPILFGTGVCEGISKAAKLFCDYLGLVSMIVMGKKNTQNAADCQELHAWNIIWIAGNPYHVDITFDLTVMTYDVSRYDYFNLSDREIQRDHLVLSEYMPKCVNSYGFYQKENLFLANQKDLMNIIGKNVNKDIVFQLPYDVNFYNARKKVMQIIRSSIQASKKTQNVEIAFNESQRVFHLHYL